jgi:hypothetical protein
MLQFHNKHGRHSIQGGTLLILNGLHGPLGLKYLPGNHHTSPVGYCGHIAKHHPETVVERHRNTHPVVLGEELSLPDKKAIVEDIVVGEGSSFG